MTDTELLDALDELHRRAGFDHCVLRMSTTGRGWRLHSVPFAEAKTLGVEVASTPRHAIRAFIEKKRGDGGEQVGARG